MIRLAVADARTVLENGGSALMGVGLGHGETRAITAAKQALASPLLDNASLVGATGVVVSITAGEDLTLDQLQQINEIVRDAVGDGIEIVFGAAHEPAMADALRVTLIVIGVEGTSWSNGARSS